MKSLLTVSLTVQEATPILETTLRERAGADSCNVTIEVPGPKPAFFSGDFDLNAPMPLAVLKSIIDRPQDKIHQIKECRAATGWGLKEAKDYVEHIWYTYLNRTNPFKPIQL